MDKTFYDVRSPGGYGGVKRFSKAAGVTKKVAEKFLSSQDAYTLHKPVRKKFKRRRYLVKGIDWLWQLDLADFQKISRQNGGYKYLLVCIDVFSKYVWLEPLKNKTALETLNGLKKILERAHPRKPNHVMTDKGGEFGRFKAYLSEQGINYYTSENVETKASVAERVIRTLKSRIYKHFTATSGLKYIDKVQDFANSYNQSYHRTIGTTPSSVNERNEAKVRKRIYNKGGRYPPKFKYAIGDNVRITAEKGVFAKGYTKKWTTEVFNITKQLPTYPPTYKIQDANGEAIIGSFYEQELQKVR